MTIPQAFELALHHLQSGRLAEAEALCRQILAVEPRHADSLHLLAVAAAQMGRNDVAVGLIRQAVAIKPNFPEAYNSLSIFLSDRGQLDEAMAACRQAIALNPNYPEAYNNFGSVLRDKGQLEDAIAACRQAIAIKANYPQAYYNLGNFLKDNDQLDDAVAAYWQAIALRPNYPEAFNNLGIVLRDKGQLEEAVAACRQAIALNPNYPEAHNNLGNALRDNKLLDEAIAAFYRAIVFKPNYPEAHNNLGNALKDKGQLDEAIAAFRRAVAFRPNYPDAHFNLGNTLRDGGQLDEAIVAYRQAIAIKPNQAESHNNLGNALKDKGQLEDAIAAYRQATTLRPNLPEAHSNLVYALLFHPGYDAQAIAEEHRRWNAQYAEPLRRVGPPASLRDRNAERRLRIGYISPNFLGHPVGRSLLPLFRWHDHQSMQITCYSDALSPDDTTEQIKAYSDQWRHTPGLSDEQLARQVEADQIDILVDLTLHMGKNRLLVFARQPAPVQITYGGYPASTGLTAMQYRLTDPHLDPPGETEQYNTEELLRLRHSFWCYPTDEPAPAVNPLPALQNGYITFGSLNNPCKYSHAVLELWSQVLAAVPGSKLMLLVHERDSYSRYFSQELQKLGIGPERLIMASKRPRSEYMALYHQVDIGLDPLPYNGHMTSCDSFWMGVPVVSLRGRTSVGRGGVSLLRNLELTELIAENPRQYVDIARGLSSERTKLNALRQGLRLRMQTSPLCGGEIFARNIEELYRQVWEKWCAAGV